MSHHGHGSLLEFDGRLVSSYVVQHIYHHSFIYGLNSSILKPRMGQTFSCTFSLIRNSLKHMIFQQVQSIFWNFFPSFSSEIKFSCARFANDFLSLRYIIWCLTAKEDIKSNTNTPYITFFIILFTFSNFWSDIIRCTHRSAQFILWIITCYDSCQSEINDLEYIILFGIDEYVVGFDISVNNIAFMEICHSL